MCYAIPGRVIELIENKAKIDYFGESRFARTDCIDVDIGDYVYAQGGFIVQKIPQENAIKILSEWKTLFFRLKDIDKKKITSKIKTKSSVVGDILEKAEEGYTIDRDEMLELFRSNTQEELEDLYNVANRVRQKNLGNSCCVHGIIEFSNYCKNKCNYCGISSHNKSLKRYRMSVDEIIKTADYAVNELGFRAIVLQSGEDSWYDDKKLIEIIQGIKENCGVLIFMSVGERGFKSYKKMYDAGARGVLFRFETSNPKVYYGLKSTEYKKRIHHLNDMKKIGYLIATGSLIGLPGQTYNDLIDDIFLAKELNADMLSFGPFIPHQNTPLGNSRLVGLDTVLKVLAISRLIMPESKILVTTALETLNADGLKRGLLSGANSLMINVTPKKYKKLYDIYPNKHRSNADVNKTIREKLDLLYSIGRAPTDIGM